MNITRLRIPGRLVTAAIMVFAGVEGFAAQPQTFTDNYTQTFTISCPYGDLNASTTVTDQGFFFLEPTDQATRIKIITSAATIITNPLNGKTAAGQQHTAQTLYQKNADWIQTGLNMSINVPGYGNVLQVAGKIVTDFHGNFLYATPLVDKATIGPLCNALQ